MVLGTALGLPYRAPSGGLTALVQAMFGTSKGAMYDFTSASTLYKDSARTLPVTTFGDFIGSATDLSPNSKHAAQSTSASRPQFQGYADFDGVADNLLTDAIDFSGTDAFTLVASVRKGSDALAGVVVALGALGSDGGFNLKAPRTAGARNSANSRGTVAVEVLGSINYPAPALMVMSVQADISADTASLRINGAVDGSNAGDQGGGTFQNAPITIGQASSSQFFSGRIYRLLVIGRALTAAELAVAERWAGRPAGIVL